MLEYLLAEQADLVGALGVEALPDGVEVEVHRVGAGRGELPEAAGHVATRADHPQPQQPRPGLVEGRDRRSASARVAPQHTGSVVDIRMASGSRPASAASRRT
jgi:hypothetical protein